MRARLQRPYVGNRACLRFSIHDDFAPKFFRRHPFSREINRNAKTNARRGGSGEETRQLMPNPHHGSITRTVSIVEQRKPVEQASLFKLVNEMMVSA